VLIQQQVFSQDSLTINSNNKIELTNEQGRKVNQFLIDRKKCYEQLALEKEYRRSKDSVSLVYKDLYYKMDRLDSSNQEIVTEFRNYVAMKDYKFQDMKTSFQDYNKQLKKQNNKTTAIIVTLFTAFAIGFGTLIALK